MVEPIRLLPPDEAMIRNEAGVFTASSLRSMYLSLAETIVRLGIVEQQIEAAAPGGVGPVGSGMQWSDDDDPIPDPDPDAPVWVIQDGREIDREDYAEYFALVGTRYGDGDGSTTFNIPDSRDRFPVGAGLNAGELGHVQGSWFHTHLVTGVVQHTHGVIDPGHFHTASDAGHEHGPGTFAEAPHTHGAGTLSVANHTHGSGTLQVENHSHTSGSLAGGSHDHSFTLLQHQHNDSFGISDPGHDHNAGSLTATNHNHGSGNYQVTIPRNAVSVQTGGIQITWLDPTASTNFENYNVSGTSTSTQPGVNGTTGSRNTGVSITGSVGNVSGALPSGSTGNSTVPISGSTGSTQPAVTGSTAGASPAVNGSTASGGGGGLSGVSDIAAADITVDPANSGITIDEAGDPSVETGENSAPPPSIAWNWIVRIK